MKNFLFILLFGFSKFAFTQIKMPQASPAATSIQSIGLSEVKIEYSRPSLKNRKMIGSELIPFGQVWRTGANKIPNISFNKEMKIAGNIVAPGTYGLITIPNKNEWTIIITKNANQWGTYSYKKEEDLFRFNVKQEKLKNKEEHFTIGFTDFKENVANIYISWENSMVKFEISNDPHKEIMREIDQKLSSSEVTDDTYYDAANYYFNKNLDINKALAWANIVLEKDKQYWTYYLRGKIAVKAGKCDVAISDATLGLEMARKENDAAYVKNLQSILDQCKKK
jgi:hypothetical protein